MSITLILPKEKIVSNNYKKVMSNLVGASPETLYVLELLNGTTSPVEEIRINAHNKILELEKNTSFLCTLLDISQLRNDCISKLALICVKNAVSKVRAINIQHTNSQNIESDSINSANLLTAIKTKILQIIANACSNDGTIITTEFAILVRKIGRWDYPLNWLPLHESLRATLEVCGNKQSHDIITYNAVFLIYHIMKEKTSMRLLRDRNMTSKLAETFFPPASILWFNTWTNKWKYGAFTIESFQSTFNDLEIKISMYLDSLLLCLYSNGLKNVYQSSERLQLLEHIIKKQNVIFNLTKVNTRQNINLVKNLKRLLRGFSRLIEHEPMDFAFLDMEAFLNGIFDYLATTQEEEIIKECMTLLTNVVKSPVINNNRYSAYYYEYQGKQHDYVTSSPMRIAQRKAVAESFTFCKTFDEMKAHCESLKSSHSDANYKRTSSPLKMGLYMGGNISEHISKQCTFMFCESLSRRGGPLQFMEFIRSKFLTLTIDEIEEWALDELIPTQEPQLSLATELIDAMKVTCAESFQAIFNAIVATETSRDFIRLESILNLYSITFPSFANLHSYKHYISILCTLKSIVSVEGHLGKLIIFRCSRILNVWSRRINLLDQETRLHILKFLLYCVCCQGDSDHSLNLRVQHLVPLYRVYKETADEPIWDMIFKEVNIEQLIIGLLSISKVPIPSIKYKSLRLVCEICLEHDGSDSNTSKYLSMVKSICTGENYTLQVAESILQTSLSFLNSLDWQKCFNDDLYINPHLFQFLIDLLLNTIVFDSSSENRLATISKYNELEEETLTLWLCLLRLLPRNVARLDRTFIVNICNLFPPLVDYVCDIKNTHIPIMETSSLVLDIIVEYFALIIDLTWFFIHSRQDPGITTSMFITQNGQSLIYRHPEMHSINLDLNKIQTLALRYIQEEKNMDITVCGLHLVTLLSCGFNQVFMGSQEFVVILFNLLVRFCQQLQEAGTIPQTPNEGMGLVALCSKTSETTSRWQPSKLSPSHLNWVGLFLPIVVRWGLDCPNTFNESLLRAVVEGNFVSETIFISLMNASVQFRNNPTLQHSAITCACMFMACLGKEAFPRLFIQRKRLNTNPGGQFLRHSTSIDPSEQFFMCSDERLIFSYLLDVATATLNLFEQSKSSTMFTSPHSCYKRDLANMSIPSSNRINLCVNISATHAKIDPHKLAIATPTFVFMGSIKCTLDWIFNLIQYMSNGSEDLMTSFMANVPDKIKYILTKDNNDSSNTITH
ncbi:bifunctional Armadillo-type fold/Armadillo-like helical [Babesia duncani]|uniref:Bifunctional Armadillo-type fold/Armadillo-like helical n=1 Tax=Babesia duncani TaxID=323732 RepID=A0AAD9UPF9_9APIC|nr:bifunctional Armadillo-type fold/Armadillo-like helical [Babesia duncani]